MFRSVARCAFALVISASLAACGTAKPATSSAPATSAGQPAAAAATDANAFTGAVAETMNSGGYTYARLQAAGKDDIWIAGNEFPVKIGDTLTAALEMPMQNFQSKTLNRTFPVVYFVSGVTRDGQAIPGAGAAPAPAPGAAGAPGADAMPMMTSHGQAKPAVVVAPVAPAPGGLSIADLWKRHQDLGGKEVILRGTIVKVNAAIMGRTWLHLQDGSGSATDGTNDITVTTDAEPKLGDVVTVTGTLAVGKDFGSGYSYKAIVENARIAAK